MKKLFVIAACIMSLSSHAALTIPASSPTAQGKWVRIDVSESGMYQISFDQLRQMGFENPEKVALFGNGGRQHPENFADALGKLNGYPGLNQVPTMLADDKILFYGRGVEDINYKRDTKYDLGGIFDRTSFNIYARFGNYILTDAVDPLYVATEKMPASSTVVDQVVDYRYFEEDKNYNPQNSGQIYWGRTFKYGNDTGQYPVTMYGVDTGIKAVAQCNIYFNDYTLSIPLNFGFIENNSLVETTNFDSPVYSYLTVPNAVGQIEVPNENATFKVQYKTRNNSGEGYLDFWMISYRKNLPTLEYENQSRGVANTISTGKGFRFQGLSEGTVVWNLSNPDEPVMGIRTKDGDIAMNAKVSYPKVIFFNPQRRMLEISGYQEIENQDLHSEAAQGADMLIITTAKMLPYAQEIARLHEEHQGLKVMVAPVEKIYNEYSGGTPDIMAYKWLVKQLYQNENRSLKNVLLFGQVTSDLRGMKVPKDYRDFIIGHQQKSVNRTTGATNSNDFICMLADYLDDSAHKSIMQVGLGVLPVRNDNHANVMVDKIRRYLEEEDFAYFNNQYSWWSCPGDEHMHDLSANATASLINNIVDNTFIEHPIVANNYTDSKLSRQEYFNLYNNGHLFNFYYGHGDPTGLAISQDLLTPVHLLPLNNKRLPFTIFAGCSIANFDRGDSGIGEKMVLDMYSGSVGALIATRETYNNENRRFMSTFFQALMLQRAEEDAPRSDIPITLGEAYARFKTATAAVNEFSYQLMCDPALVLPIPRYTINVNPIEPSAVGSRIKVKGSVENLEGEKITGYNGTVVVRLMDAPQELICQNLLVTEKTDFNYTKSNEVINLIECEAVNGEFECSLMIPFNITAKDGMSLAISAYDKSTHISAANRVALNVVEAAPGSIPNDRIPPVISNLLYDPATNVLSFDLADETALDFRVDPFRPALELKIDGTSISPYLILPAEVRNEGRDASFKISLPAIYKGQHSAHLQVADMAANRTREEYIFSTDYEMPMMALSISEDANTEGVTLLAEGNLDNAKVYVSDYSNRTICSLPLHDNEWRWDFTDSSGHRLPTGLYRLHVASPTGYSQQVIIPVL